MSGRKEPSTEKRKFTLDFFKNTVKLIIGKREKKVEIDVPSQRLCEHSEFFKAACSDRWFSGRQSVIHLEDEDPKVFSLFLAWAFDGSIQNSEDFVTLNPEYSDHGQRLLAHEFKNAAMDLLVANYALFYTKFQDIPSNSSLINKIYAETSAGSPLRRSFVDTVLGISTSAFFTRESSRDEHESTKCFEEFLVEVVTAAHPFIRSKEVASISKACFNRDPCSYHEHRDKPAGYSCTKKQHHCS